MIWLDPPQATTALLLLDREMEKAHLQFGRIRESREAIAQNMRILGELARVSTEKSEIWFDQEFQERRERAMSSSHKLSITLFADIHFLMICLDKIELLIRMLEKHLGSNSEIASIRQQHSTSLKDYNDFRNHLEHIDERVERGISDLGNLSGDAFTFDGRYFDIGPQRERELEQIYGEVVKACEAISAGKGKST